MNMSPSNGLYAITDCEHFKYDKILEKTETILRSGAALLQFRNKDRSDKKKIRLANELKILCSELNCPFIINDDLMLARIIKPDGIHLGKHDTDPGKVREYLGHLIIGISCYNDFQRAIKAKNDAVDYVALGSFYPSITKPDAGRAKLSLITKVKRNLSIPIVAIGGITPENGKKLLDAGADYLAVISGIYTPDDPAVITRKYVELFNYD